MDPDLAREAINAAIDCEWENAVKINEEILKSNPRDIDALNRLSRAYFEIGNIEKTISYVKKALDIDPINSIAIKTMKKCDGASMGNTTHRMTSNTHPSVFLEEPGKTKYVNLVNVAKAELVSLLTPGIELNVNFHDHSASLTLQDGKYVGKLPDNIAMRLIKLSKDGYLYRVFIKRIEDQQINVFIRETSRADEDTPSFPSQNALA